MSIEQNRSLNRTVKVFTVPKDEKYYFHVFNLEENKSLGDELSEVCSIESFDMSNINQLEHLIFEASGATREKLLDTLKEAFGDIISEKNDMELNTEV